MLPQFELQKKRRMHAKRRRQEQRQKVALIVFSITCLLGVLIFFNIFYIFRNTPESSNDGGRLQTEAQMKGARNVRRRFGPWVSKDSQPFVSVFAFLSLLSGSHRDWMCTKKFTHDKLSNSSCSFFLYKNISSESRSIGV